MKSIPQSEIELMLEDFKVLAKKSCDNPRLIPDLNHNQKWSYELLLEYQHEEWVDTIQIEKLAFLIMADSLRERFGYDVLGSADLDQIEIVHPKSGKSFDMELAQAIRRRCSEEEGEDLGLLWGLWEICDEAGRAAILS